MTRLIECAGCQRPMEDEGVPYCLECDWATGDEECGACGSVLGLDGGCTCDLGHSQGRAYWERRAA